MIDVFMDEKFIGEIENYKEFLKSVKDERKKGKLPSTLNIWYNDELKEVHIEIANGRVRRPLIVVENSKSKLTEEDLKKLEANELTWKEMFNQGIMEYLDAAEEENAYVALSEEDITPEHTHVEISPSIILGLTTSLVPFANFGQSSRLNRGSKAQKQALGFYSANYLVRMDTDVNILHYPQNPLVKSFMYDVSKQNLHPAGQNIIIALMSYEGYNMQDALVFNKGSIDLGLARSTYYRPYKAEELRYSGGLIDEICIPDKEVKGYRSEEDYKLLEDDGIIFPESIVKEDDVIIGKTSPPRFVGELDEFSIAANKRRESSVTMRHGEPGKVDFVMVTENEEGMRLVKTRLRHQRIPEIGDKFASRHGQKGVVGLIVPEADMPFTVTGVKPDLIFSPHSIPSRMTVSHLIEVLAGKTGALDGRTIDATTFASEKEHDLRKTLMDLGFREDGTETLYNGLTGEKLKAKKKGVKLTYSKEGFKHKDLGKRGVVDAIETAKEAIGKSDFILMFGDEVLIDADMRRGNIHELLGIEKGVGLSDVLIEKRRSIEVEKVKIESDVNNLSVSYSAFIGKEFKGGCPFDKVGKMLQELGVLSYREDDYNTYYANDV